MYVHSYRPVVVVAGCRPRYGYLVGKERGAMTGDIRVYEGGEEWSINVETMRMRASSHLRIVQICATNIRASADCGLGVRCNDEAYAHEVDKSGFHSWLKIVRWMISFFLVFGLFEGWGLLWEV
jgi:hypothetical protein